VRGLCDMYAGADTNRLDIILNQLPRDVLFVSALARVAASADERGAGSRGPIASMSSLGLKVASALTHLNGYLARGGGEASVSRY
jgi:hypothetical protein